MGDFTKLFNQFADDMDLFWKRDKNSMKYIMSMLNTFCRNTGCKINYDKTTLYRIGVNNTSVVKIYTSGLKMEKEKISVLGVWLSNSREKMEEFNYKDL